MEGWAEGWAEGWILIYYWLPPAGGRIRSQGNKMRRLKPKGFIESSTLGVAQGRGAGLALL